MGLAVSGIAPTIKVLWQIWQVTEWQVYPLYEISSVAIRPIPQFFGRFSPLGGLSCSANFNANVNIFFSFATTPTPIN